MLGVNSNTVLRALRALWDETLLEFQRARGITEAGTAEREAEVKRIRELVDSSRTKGYERYEIAQTMQGLP
jgi:GntR family transcriptional regulator